jgi:lipid II:glycine glycyltransferase (peptidoglycan interpeptide bridge formation enzyme)
MIQLFPNSDSEWNQALLRFPDAHILQTWQWAEAKKQNGWLPLFFRWEKGRGDPLALAMILRRQLSLMGMKFSVLYCPKGPVFNYDQADSDEIAQVLNDLQRFARDSRAIFLKIDPDILLGTGIPGSENEIPNPQGLAFQKDLERRGWQFSPDQIQFRNTVLLDLSQDEAQLLAAMKQKTRYNIRLAAKKGVAIREGSPDDLPMLYKMYAQTAVRDNFVIRHEEYYQKTWRGFLQADMAKILIAEVGGEPVSALILFHFNGVSRYMFGMSTDRCRELMPNHLLQWEAVRLSKALGCRTYDLWGAPDVFDASDSMWGVYRFKQGFNGVTARHLGAWDFSSRNFLYHSYTRVLPKLLDVMRSRGKAATQKQVQND